MKRGDVVTVAAPGDYGKARPAVVVQTDALPDSHPSILVCLMTSAATEASEFRVRIAATESNGLRLQSEIMADKLQAVRRERIGAVIGRLNADDITRLNAAVAFVVGLGG